MHQDLQVNFDLVHDNFPYIFLIWCLPYWIVYFLLAVFQFSIFFFFVFLVGFAFTFFLVFIIVGLIFLVPSSHFSLSDNFSISQSLLLVHRFHSPMSPLLLIVSTCLSITKLQFAISIHCVLGLLHVSTLFSSTSVAIISLNYHNLPCCFQVSVCTFVLGTRT